MIGFNYKANKFVCPNDRQLALRAKLRTGWSVSRSGTPLTAEEQARIVEVIRRSEQLDEVEARRVGRLVDRVESMRRSAHGIAPHRCLVCGDRPGLLSPLRRCLYCGHMACSKCVIENGHHRDQFLCNICAETREMWKKSGAWFFKGIPKYVLPERRGTNRYSDTKLAASLQEVSGCGVGEPSLIRAESADLGAHAFALPAFSRQTSSTESHKSAFQENNLDSLSEMEVLQHGVSGLSLNRAESLSQKSSAGGLRRTGSRGSAYSLRSFKKDIAPAPVSPEKPPSVISDSAYGALEIRLVYEATSSSLACVILRARGLPPMDMAGLCDTFCRLDILPTDATQSICIIPEGTCSNGLRTKTVHKTRNPEFNETVTFYGITDTDISSKTLRIVIFDDDRYGCDVMGSTSVVLRDVIRGDVPHDLKLALGPEPEAPDAPPRPQVLLSLSYNTKKRALVVLIGRCTNLPPMDSNGYSDPFVKLHLDPDPYHRKHKTSIKWRNLNPVFNEEFIFETRPTELSKQSLNLTVWDKDYGKPNDFLGSLVIGAASKGKRLKHWLDCIKFPDHRHEQWHNLTDTEHL